MFTTAALQPLLAERGGTLSTSQGYRLVTEKPERLSLTVLMALLDIFGCPMDDLIKPTIAARPPAPSARPTAKVDRVSETRTTFAGRIGGIRRELPRIPV